MLKRFLFALVGVSVFGAGLAPAQQDDEKIKVGDYAPDFEAGDWLNLEGDEPPSLAELRGLVVVIFFWAGWHEGGQMVITAVNEYENNDSIGRTGGVYTIGLTNANRGQAERMARDAMVFFPIGVDSKAAEEFGIQSDFGFVVVNTAGKVTFKGGGGDLAGLTNAIVEALRETPPWKTHPKEAQRVRRLMDQMRAAFRAADYRRAFRIGRDAITRTVVGDPLASEVFEMFDLMEALGYERLDQVRPLIEQKQYAEAARLARSVRRELTVLEAGKDARRIYERWQELSDGFREAAREHVRSDEAARLYYEARDQIKAHRYGQAYDLLDRILTEYPDTDAAPYATEMIDRMKAMPALWVHVLDHKAEADCRNWLSQAKLHIRNRQRAEARQLLERIVREYPDTIFEKEARDLLVGM